MRKERKEIQMNKNYRRTFKEWFDGWWTGPRSIGEFWSDLNELKEYAPGTYRNFIVSCIALVVSILMLILQIAITLG